MFQKGEKWTFVQCPKTDDFDNPCPICSVVNRLFKGSEDDKNEARRLKRKIKYISNVFVVSDPRDVDKADDDETKAQGSVCIYEFPGKLYTKISEEIKDRTNGLGSAIFEPGSEGYNFIIKVGAQASGDGGSFPEYSMSNFARKASPIADSEEKIAEIMETRIPLDEYLESTQRSQESIIEIIKEMLLWDLIKNDYKIPETKQESDVKLESKEEEKKVESKQGEKEPEKSEPEVKKEESKKSNDEITEDELLAELENM